jgi:hypothetical protein
VIENHVSQILWHWYFPYAISTLRASVAGDWWRTGAVQWLCMLLQSNHQLLLKEEINVTKTSVCLKIQHVCLR